MTRSVRRRYLAAAGTAYAATGVLLLRRMRRELLARGRLSPVTVTWMYATYGTHATASAWMLRRGPAVADPRLPFPKQGAGSVLVLGGAVLSLAGASRFAGPRQLSGTQLGTQISSGIYRYSRNPQYTGLILVLLGLALARRSSGAAVLAAGAAGAYRWWIPVEESHLEAEFGQQYRTYRARTPRWLGLPDIS